MAQQVVDSIGGSYEDDRRRCRPDVHWQLLRAKRGYRAKQPDDERRDDAAKKRLSETEPHICHHFKPTLDPPTRKRRDSPTGNALRYCIIAWKFCPAIDSSLRALSLIGSVSGNRALPHCVNRFSQTGGPPDPCREYWLDTWTILAAAAELFL